MLLWTLYSLSIERQAAKSFVTVAEMGLQKILFLFGFGLNFFRQSKNEKFTILPFILLYECNFLVLRKMLN